MQESTSLTIFESYQLLTALRKRADLSVERAIRDRMDRDMLVFPIIYNYRHFIELSLKYLIETYGGIVGISPHLEHARSFQVMEKIDRNIREVWSRRNG